MLWIAYLFKKWRLIFVILLLHVFSDWFENYVRTSNVKCVHKFRCIIRRGSIIGFRDYSIKMDTILVSKAC